MTTEAPQTPIPVASESAATAKGTENGTNSAEATPAAVAQDPLLADLPLSAADGLIKKPIPRPLDSVKIIPPAALTEDQQAKYDSLLAAVSEWTTVPTTSANDAPTAPITDEERMFLTRDCLLRYLRATKWNVTDATTRLRATLTWRREYGVEKLTADYISIENETGKQFILGYDINGRPCLYLNPAKQNTEKSDRQVEHLVFMLERLIDIMIPEQESWALVINFSDTRSGQNASIGQGKQTLSILQHHYPERLGRALVLNIPFVIWGFLKVITPFIDPLTREKLKFNEDLRAHVSPSQLTKNVGGDVEFEYDHSIYWPTLNKLADQRRNEYRKRWVKAGKRVGENENYLRGGSGKSLAETEGTAAGQSEELQEKMASLNVDAPKLNGEVAPEATTAP